jgi:hypothetical protein
MKNKFLSLIAARLMLGGVSQIKACSEGCLEGLLYMLSIVRPRTYIALEQYRIAYRESYLASFTDPENYLARGTQADNITWARQLDRLNRTRNRVGLNPITEEQLLHEGPEQGLREANTDMFVHVDYQ